MKAKVTDGEKEYTFNGEYRTPIRDDLYLSSVGKIEKAICSHGTGKEDVRAIVHLLPVIFGGIEWEVIDHRQPKRGEWIVYDSTVCPARASLYGEYDIVEPVSICAARA